MWVRDVNVLEWILQSTIYLWERHFYLQLQRTDWKTFRFLLVWLVGVFDDISSLGHKIIMWLWGRNGVPKSFTKFVERGYESDQGWIGCSM